VRNISIYLLVLGVGICLSADRLLATEDQEDFADAVEVVIQGRKYKSIREYKRQQIKSTLKKSLSSFNLKEFSEDELLEIMTEVRKEQPSTRSSGNRAKLSESSDEQSLKNHWEAAREAEDRKTSQMVEMLKQYQRDHEDARPISIDPDKVRSIIIKP
jgi:hypothetical protein